MPLSNDPRKRSRQVANLRRGGTAIHGNRNAERHGGYAGLAAERVDEKVADLMGQLGDTLPLRGANGGVPVEDVLALRLLAECLVRLDTVSEFIAREGWQDAKGNVRPVVEYERRLRGEALNLCRELGLTPRARAALGLDLVNVATAEQRLTEHLADQYGEDK